MLKPLSENFLRTNTTTAFMISPSSHSDKKNSFSHLKAESAELELFESESTKAENQHNGELAKWRGIVIHRFIELLCNKNQYPAKNEYCNDILLRLKNETSLTKPDYIYHLDECLQEAITTFNSPLFEDIFNPADNSASFNEMPLMYKQKQQAVYGFVDKIIKTETTVTILDYKSHQLKSTETALEVAQQSSKQLNDYVTGIKQIWPKHKIKAGILFTHHQEIVWLV